MIINNVGFNHCHDADFYINRPDGSGDYLFLAIKSKSVFDINGTSIIIPENTIFIYNKGTPQYYRALNGSSFSNDWIHFLFEDNELEEFIRLNIPFDTPIYNCDINQISFFIKSISSENYSCNTYKDKTIKKYIEIMFYKISESLCLNSMQNINSNYEMLLTIRNKIYTKPYESRNIESSAHEVRMSPSNFQHLYKKAFGISFINDIIQSRIEYAKLHLTQTDITVKGISELCGYNNITHFFRQFKDVTGMTPIEYRKNKKEIL